MADILLIDDQDRYIELCRRAMPQHRYRGPARSWREAADTLGRARGRVDMVLLDVHFAIPSDELLGFEQGMSERAVRRLEARQGLHILTALRARYPDLPVVLMTSRDDLALEDQSEALLAQDTTYFLDDEQIDVRTLSALIESIAAARKGQEADGPVFWGRSMPMRRLRHRLTVLARGRLPVVLLGPTGTGKSLLARHYVHERSGRTGRFVAVDLSTIPPELMASHLFGSVKGAYTGSIGDRVGAFEAAHGGTLFLDELANLSHEAQKMLLTVLQEGVVTRLGDLRERVVDVKLVVATNEDLGARVRDGSFRSDLYMRLNPAAAVCLPSLAERHVDLDALLRFCLVQALDRPYLRGLLADYRERFALNGGEVRVVTGGSVGPQQEGTLVLLFPERTMRLLRGHSWPGNLREFAMTVENALLFALSEMIMVSSHERADVVQVRPKLVRDLLEHAPTADSSEADGHGLRVVLRPQTTLNKVAVDCERQYFTQLYLAERGDFSAMALALLGDAEHARKVQLRFNQLGLKVRELKERLRAQ